jgi:enoyl-CoA hydratase/carnithine racemase
MAGNPVLYQKKDHIGYITLNRPENGNRIDLALAQELAGVCAGISGDEDVYLVVITGAGEVFCAGGDTRQLVLSNSGEELPAKQGPAEAVGALDRPVLAALNGEAIGEGLEIALACDFRIASEKARFGLPQVAEGWIPMDGGTQRLSRIVGKGKALEMVLTGGIIDAQAGLEIGLVNKVVSQDSLKSEIEALATALAAKAPLSLRYAKEAVNKGLDLTLEQGLRLEADLYFLLHTTADRTEGIQSFLQKRKPEYKGK